MSDIPFSIRPNGISLNDVGDNFTSVTVFNEAIAEVNASIDDKEDILTFTNNIFTPFANGKIEREGDTITYFSPDLSQYLNNVNLGTLANDDTLKYDSASGKWINAVSGGGGGGDPDITDTNTDATYYPVFVDSTGSSKTLRADTTTLPFSVNPSNGNFILADTIKIDQNKVAIGKNAGRPTQGNNSVAVGVEAGKGQSGNSIAIGPYSAYGGQLGNAVAIGNGAGFQNQKNNGIAIGESAGEQTQGIHCIAIGALAGFQNQHNNSIVLNATGSTTNTTQASSFFVNPIRGLNNPIAGSPAIGTLWYNTATKEICYQVS